MLQTRKINDTTVAVAFEPTEILLRKSGKSYFGTEKPLVQIIGDKVTFDPSVAKEFNLKIDIL